MFWFKVFTVFLFDTLPDKKKVSLDFGKKTKGIVEVHKARFC